MSEHPISRETIERYRNLGIETTASFASNSGQRLVGDIVRALLAADDALKPFYDSGWLATLCALESVPDDVAVILSFKKEGMGGATSEIKVGDFRKARAAMLPREEVDDATVD